LYFQAYRPRRSGGAIKVIIQDPELSVATTASEIFHMDMYNEVMGSMVTDDSTNLLGYYEELDNQTIKILGDWNPDTQEDRYSAKLPLQGLRVMAGHSKNKGQFYLPRSGLPVPASLLLQIFPFIEGTYLLQHI
jgi:hypothetical protein